MQTKDFLEILRDHRDKTLLFEYEAGQFIDDAYHITEVKNVHIESMDCGGRPDEYYQTIIQLWWNGTEQKERAMTAGKALKILEIVEQKRPMRYETPIFFEWGHGDLRTSNYVPNEVEITDDSVVLKLFVPPTVCKPKYELEIAGQNSDSVCCSPNELKVVGQKSGCC